MWSPKLEIFMSLELRKRNMPYTFLRQLAPLYLVSVITQVSAFSTSRHLQIEVVWLQQGPEPWASVLKAFQHLVRHHTTVCRRNCSWTFLKV